MKAPIIFEFSYFVDFISCNKQDNLAPEMQSICTFKIQMYKNSGNSLDIYVQLCYITDNYIFSYFNHFEVRIEVQKPRVSNLRIMRSEDNCRKGDLPKLQESHFSWSWFCYWINAELSYRRLYGGLSYAQKRYLLDCFYCNSVPSLLLFCVYHWGPSPRIENLWKGWGE